LGFGLGGVSLELSFNPLGAVIQIVLSTLTMGLSDIILGALGINPTNPKLEQLTIDPLPPMGDVTLSCLIEWVIKKFLSFLGARFSIFLSGIRYLVAGAVYLGLSALIHSITHQYVHDEREWRNEILLSSLIMIIIRFADMVRWRRELSRRLSLLFGGLIIVLLQNPIIAAAITSILRTIAIWSDFLMRMVFTAVDVYFAAAALAGWPVSLW